MAAQMKSNITRTERGWGGHFICSSRCLFRRNTLLQRGTVSIVVSTVGAMCLYEEEGKFEQIGCDRYYETMVFHSMTDDTRYHDADVTREVCLENVQWQINYLDADDKANNMHERAVESIIKRIKKGEFDNE